MQQPPEAVNIRQLRQNGVQRIPPAARDGARPQRKLAGALLLQSSQLPLTTPFAFIALRGGEDRKRHGDVVDHVLKPTGAVSAAAATPSWADRLASEVRGGVAVHVDVKGRAWPSPLDALWTGRLRMPGDPRADGQVDALRRALEAVFPTPAPAARRPGFPRSSLG